MAKTKTSRLDRLQATLTSLQNEFDKEKERVRHKKRRDRLQEPMKAGMIPKPRGRPGRAGPDSYNVMNAMKLSKAQYNFVAHRIRTLVARYLDVTRTLSQQPDKMLVEKVIARARSQSPILKQYEGGWAIRDIMAQYLRNRAVKERQLTRDAEIVFPAKKRKEVDGGDSEEDEEAELAPKFQPTKRARRSESESELSEESGGWDEEDSDLDDFDSGDSEHGNESENETTAQKKASQSNKVSKDSSNEKSNDLIITKLSKLGASKSNKANKGSSGVLVVSKQSKSGGKAKVKANKDSSNEESDEPLIDSKQSRSGPSSGKTKAKKGSSDEESDEPPTVSKQSRSSSKVKANKDSSDEESDEPPIVSKQSRSGPSGGKAKAKKGSSDEESDEPPIVSKQSRSSSKVKANKGSSDEIIACKRSKSGSSKSTKMSEGGTALMKVSNPGEELKGRREETVSNEVIKIRVPKSKLPKSSDSVDGTKDTTAKGFRSSVKNKEFEAGSTAVKRNAADFSYTSDSDSDAGVLSPNGDWLQRCPECKEDMPSTILPYLASLIERYCNLRRRSGRFTIPVSRMAMDICNLVRKEKLKDLALETAAKQKWPISEINFRLILKQMHALSGELNQLIFNKAYVEKSFIWNVFKESLTADGLSIETFSSLRAGEINPASNVALRAETGYYGMKGNAIIMHTLFGIYPQTRTPTAAFHPLSYSYFLSYVLTPYIAIELIAEDLKCNLEDAYQQMIKSSPVGSILFRDTDGDEELDSIYRDNIVQYQQRKANNTFNNNTNFTPAALPETNQHLSSELQPRPLPRRFDRVINVEIGADTIPQDSQGTTNKQAKQQKAKHGKGNVKIKEHQTRARSKPQPET